MDFKDLCTFFEEIKQATSPKEKSKLIQDRFKKIRDLIKHDTGANIFPILRLIVPNLDRERDHYNMKEAKVARTLIKMLDLPPGNDKNVLSKSYLMSGQAADFGDVVYSVIRRYLSNYKTTLTIEQLNSYLDDLTNRQSEAEAENILMNMFKKSSPENIRWIIRIILKDLKLGIGSNSILNSYHRDGAAYYASNNSLRKVCNVLANQNVKLHELEIEIFEPFRPMLSKRIDGSNFKKEFPENKLFYTENKFDGERFQLHMADNKFKYFSRNGFDYTSNLGENYETGIFTPQLKGLFRENVSRIILDGELMIWDKRTSKFGSKGMTLDVKKMNDRGPYQPCFCVYDIILLNDKILTNDPLKDRIRTLRTAFKSLKPGVIILSDIKEVNSRQEIVDELNFAVDKEDEGIIIKDPNSIYKYSDRKGGWYKMKLEYFEDAMNDLDLILMGGQYASSTSDTLNSFLVGIRSGKAENGRPLYLSLGKVSSGVTNEQLITLNKKLKTEGKKFENFSSQNLSFGKEVPNYYIEPEHSLVFQVRATELIRNTDSSFKTPYTLRFPRILKIRDDKPVDECLTINELLDLTRSNKAVIKLNKRNIELDEILNVRMRKMTRREIIMPTILDDTKVSDILEGYTIHVLNGTETYDKEKVENIIRKAGGTVSYRINDKVDIVLVGTPVPKVKQLVGQQNKFDLINIRWLQRIIQDGNLLGYDQEEVYGLGYNYKNCLSDELDMYGDSYMVETNVDKLKKTFEIISCMGEFSNRNNTMGLKNRKRFDDYTAYFDKYKLPEDPSSENANYSVSDELEFRYYNGNVSDKITDAVNVIIYNGDEDRRKILEDYLRSVNRSGIKILPKTFIYEEDICFK
ncbi:hypothetical protein NQ317_012198 [Molorchus minor]|uniref:DNA ligase 4 n=1 Tax=Molorchus minor TaxID=1323400 RepID=A0ABQ9K2U9_9CUCU|nr:hypothetical protein NQ317_012198 [Molorchus minor]